MPNDNYVLRLRDKFDLTQLQKRFTIDKGNSYISYTCSSIADTLAIIPGSTDMTEEAIHLMKRNGYTELDIRNYFVKVLFGLA